MPRDASSRLQSQWAQAYSGHTAVGLSSRWRAEAARADAGAWLQPERPDPVRHVHTHAFGGGMGSSGDRGQRQGLGFAPPPRRVVSSRSAAAIVDDAPVGVSKLRIGSQLAGTTEPVAVAVARGEVPWGSTTFRQPEQVKTPRKKHVEPVQGPFYSAAKHRAAFAAGAPILIPHEAVVPDVDPRDLLPRLKDEVEVRKPLACPRSIDRAINRQDAQLLPSGSTYIVYHHDPAAEEETAEIFSTETPPVLHADEEGSMNQHSASAASDMFARLPGREVYWRPGVFEVEPSLGITTKLRALTQLGRMAPPLQSYSGAVAASHYGPSQDILAKIRDREGWDDKTLLEYSMDDWKKTPSKRRKWVLDGDRRRMQHALSEHASKPTVRDQLTNARSEKAEQAVAASPRLSQNAPVGTLEEPLSALGTQTAESARKTACSDGESEVEDDA
eukprot:TRINITY_DN23504_c0_g3_i1.p1 TRINITY_DN23504_c0_g3~~TRINITY_DN23504_c0_g3_i1.p1  ORF type:complete len:444 (+),score=64.50 TRINITY_DN23504_c0_g3_i1:96-1427(+)